MFESYALLLLKAWITIGVGLFVVGTLAAFAYGVFKTVQAVWQASTEEHEEYTSEFDPNTVRDFDEELIYQRVKHITREEKN